MVTIEKVNPADHISDIRELLAKNWEETGFDFPFNPNVSAYQALYESGLCFALRAANEYGDVIGYCTVVVVPHAHNPEVIVASNDALFVDKPYRNGIVPGRLILSAEKHAREMGATRFTWHCRYGTALADVLIKHGYSPVDVVVMKNLSSEVK